MHSHILLAIIAKTVTAQQCDNIDPIIRGDCGMEAAGGDNIVTKDECENTGCCWDTSDYGFKTPWCYYSLQFDSHGNNYIEIEETIVTDDNDTIEPVKPTTEKPTIIIEKVIVEKVQPTGIKPTARPSVLKTINTKPAKTSSKPTIMKVKTKKPPVKSTKPVKHTDLVVSYRKKTCQQLNATTTLNATMKALTMDRMKCNTVDFANFDADADPNLNKDTSEGMKVLMEKYKEAAAEKTSNKPASQPKNPLVGNNPGGIFSVFDERYEEDLGGISETEKMILKNPLMVRMMPEKVKKIKKRTSGCKRLTESLAPEYNKKSAFTSTHRQRLRATCGDVPSDAHMSNLLIKLGIAKKIVEEDENNWKLPNVAIEYELIGWNVMEYCLARIDILNEKFNCYDKSDDIYDYQTCSKKGKIGNDFNYKIMKILGCIYFDQQCFYCKQAIQNQKENKIVVDSIDEDEGECAVPTAQKQECKVSSYNFRHFLVILFLRATKRTRPLTS